MQAAYLANPNSLITPNPLGGFQTLQAYRVDASALQNIIAGLDSEGNSVQDPCPEVMLMLGVRQQDLGKPVNEQCFTTILVGINANNEVQTQVVYDFGKPCPPDCPAS